MANIKLGGTTAITESGGVVTFVNAGGLRSMQVFTSTGTSTWTKPAGITTIKVFCTGGGGGGGGHGAADDLGAAGGGGGTAIKIYDVSSTASVVVTVGAGGLGKSGMVHGLIGVASSFPGPGQTITGNPGDGGKQGNAGPVLGGSGGTATGGDLNLIGGDGGNGLDENVATASGYLSAYGVGGATFWGGGGRGASHTTAAREGQNYGTGGGGGSEGSTAGKDGKSGVVVIEEYS